MKRLLPNLARPTALARQTALARPTALVRPTALARPTALVLTAALALTTALVAPGMAQARPVTLTANLNAYGGNGAYLAVYLTDANGTYQGSLWMAGGKAKYFKHLSDWYAATGGDRAEVDGITGASVGQGRSLAITVDLADVMIDAGYALHIDAAVEDMRNSPSEIVVPLTSAGAGVAVKGGRYIADFTYGM